MKEEREEEKKKENEKNCVKRKMSLISMKFSGTIKYNL